MLWDITKGNRKYSMLLYLQDWRCALCAGLYLGQNQGNQQQMICIYIYTIPSINKGHDNKNENEKEKENKKENKKILSVVALYYICIVIIKRKKSHMSLY